MELQRGDRLPLYFSSLGQPLFLLMDQSKTYNLKAEASSIGKSR
ncbi:hypothetical protein [Paenibacillus sp. HWE-109]|nr:hypothetical protein [Paenibacillus sp. HWE-109]